MSEQINKVLADRPQNFTTAEQLQARTNIGAQASGDYVSSTTFTAYSASIATSKLDASASSMFQPSGNYQTAGDYAYNSAVSSKQDSSAMSSYVPFSSIGADTGSAITSINGSSVGNFTGCSANNNITGNGLPGSPLGLSSEVWFTSYGASARLRYDQLGMYTDTGNTYTEIDRGALHVLQRTGSLDYQAEYGHFYGTGMRYSHSNMSDVQLSANWEGLYIETANGIDSASSRFDASSLQFKDGSGNLHVVDSASIDRWNGYSAGNWNESGNSLSTGYGGNQVTAASQFNVDAGNWACRRVKMQGIPDQDLYGFQSKPNGTGTAYMVNPAGAFVQYQPNYFTYLYHRTGAVYEDLDTSIYPTGLTGNARLDFVNLCSAASANVKTDTFHGTTADFKPGESATMWYIAAKGVWTDGSNDVPV